MKIMVIIDHLAFSDRAFSVLKEINDIVEKSLDEVSICCLNLSNKVIRPECAVFNPSEIACFYDGLMISTSIETAKLACKSKNNSKHMLYLWDIDFLFSSYDYNTVYDLFNSQLVVVKSEEHRKIINNLFNVATVVMDRLNLEELWNLQ